MLEDRRIKVSLNFIGKNEKALFLLVLGGKLFLLALFSSEYSRSLFFPFVEVFVNGEGNPWQYFLEKGMNIDVFPYHGFMLYLLAIPVYLIELLGIQNEVLQNFIFKLPLIFSDLLIFFVLTKLFFRVHKNKILFFYFLNPIILYSTYIHSQLDIIPMSLLMFALFALKKEKLMISSVFIGLAIGSKLHVLMVLPLLFFYIIKKETWMKSILMLISSMAVFLVLDSLFLGSEGFQKMVLFNSKQSLLFDSYIEIGELLFLIPVALILLVYLHFFNQRKVNYDLLSFYLIILFASAIFSIYPSPGWYVWLIPFMSIYFIRSENLNKAIFLYTSFSCIYILFFIFFYKSDYIDLLFLNEELNFKFTNVDLRNVVFTVLQVSLISVIYAFYKYGIRSNSVYKMTSNITIGIGGDSGVGKTTLGISLRKLLGQKLVEIEGDGEHKWERGDENWNTYTHLDPKANHIHKQAQVIHDLKFGKSIRRNEYNHDTGKLTESSIINPKDFIVISGLHPFYLPKLRKIIDVKVYLDTDEKLRRHWKVIRDTKKRGYGLNKIIGQIESRVSDADKFIHPQKQYADLIINYFPSKDFELGSTNSEIDLGLKLTINANIQIEDILEALDCDYEWDYNDDMRSQFIRLRQTPSVNFKNIAYSNIKNLNEIIPETTTWESGYSGLIQLVVLKMIVENMKV